MSLIILSSAQTGVGVQSPAKFSNALSNTITIPPNSEVGVVSCKFFRDPAIVALPTQMFIRSNTLTHQSYNFNKGLPSKILWSVPAFANNGPPLAAPTMGALYYQQDSPIYLDLNNAAPVVINDIDIEFVDKDEVPVTDLTQESVVVLHIRKSRA
jgi:hypothetical protein